MTRSGTCPPLWLGAIFVAVLLSAYLAQQIGIAAIFGAFVMGLIMPRHAGLTDDVSSRLEDFVVMVLLPLFFIITGLRTEVGSLNRPVLWLITLGLIAVAIVGKWVGATVAARYGGFGLRESAAIGALMNTRGLTELIVLNIGLELGLVSPTLFTMLVIMALVTTFMAGPALRLVDPQKLFSSPPEEEVREAMAEEGVEPRHSVVVSAQDEKNLDALLAIAEPLATTEPPRELIIARLVATVAVAPGPLADERELRRATEEVNTRRDLLRERGIDVRAVAFTTPDAGEDLVQLGSDRVRRPAARRRAQAAARARACPQARSALHWSTRRATWACSSRAQGCRRSMPRTRSSCRSAAPSTTGPPSSSARGSPRPAARR